MYASETHSDILRRVRLILDAVHVFAKLGALKSQWSNPIFSPSYLVVETETCLVKLLLMAFNLYLEYFPSRVPCRFSMRGCRHIWTPMVQSLCIGLKSRDDSSVVEITCDKRVMGSLSHLAFPLLLDMLPAPVILVSFGRPQQCIVCKPLSEFIVVWKENINTGLHFTLV